MERQLKFLPVQIHYINNHTLTRYTAKIFIHLENGEIKIKLDHAATQANRKMAGKDKRMRISKVKEELIQLKLYRDHKSRPCQAQPRLS